MGAAGWSDVQVKDLLSACTRPVKKAPSLSLIYSVVDRKIGNFLTGVSGFLCCYQFKHLKNLWTCSLCWTINYMATQRSNILPLLCVKTLNVICLLHLVIFPANMLQWAAKYKTASSVQSKMYCKWSDHCWSLLLQQWHQPSVYWLLTVRPSSPRHVAPQCGHTASESTDTPLWSVRRF